MHESLAVAIDNPNDTNRGYRLLMRWSTGYLHTQRQGCTKQLPFLTLTLTPNPSPYPVVTINPCHNTRPLSCYNWRQYVFLLGHTLTPVSWYSSYSDIRICLAIFHGSHNHAVRGSQKTSSLPPTMMFADISWRVLNPLSCHELGYSVYCDE